VILLLLALAQPVEECKVSLVTRSPTISWTVTFDDPKIEAAEEGVRLWRARNQEQPIVIPLSAGTRQYVDKNVIQEKTTVTYRYRAQVFTSTGRMAMGQPEVCYTVTAPVVIDLTTAVIEITEVK
jgi:hypothetical protein